MLLNKAKGVSSNQALQQVKKLFGIKKAGHTGTLDPLATGMLPICLGEATKFSQYSLHADKSYQVKVELGITTTTGDSEGEVLKTHSIPLIVPTDLNKLLQERFTGKILQTPPMYSAIKHQGQPLYKLARKGISIPRSKREIEIYKIKLLHLENAFLNLEVYCSSGTYIRSLVEDIGEALDSGAFVKELHRLQVSPFEPNQMINFDQLQRMVAEQVDVSSYFLPIESFLLHFPQLELTLVEEISLKNGRRILKPNPWPLGLIRLYNHHNHFIGLGEIKEDSWIFPRRLLSFQKDQSTQCCNH